MLYQPHSSAARSCRYPPLHAPPAPGCAPPDVRDQPVEGTALLPAAPERHPVPLSMAHHLERLPAQGTPGDRAGKPGAG
jgi:hypothetical protein